MNLSLLICARISAVFLICVVFFGCAVSESSGVKGDTPVSWSPAFTMPELVDLSYDSITDIRNFPDLISAPWYAGIGVENKKGEKVFLSSCEDLFHEYGPKTHTIKANEMAAYLELKVMCETTRLLINSDSAKYSFIPDVFLDEFLPKVWPKEIAMTISTLELKRISDNSNFKVWGDVMTIDRFEKDSEEKATYFHDGGFQEVDVLGNGDFNGDDTNDIFVVVRDHVTGGDYFNVRLFVLSVNRKGDWELLESF
ncbi:hypothetical protein FE845_01175 [Marinobacter sp. 1-4A]|uniref:hypothetical protein n=1 Tax=Marinobacter sp. 1-4A TaxID=2582919 RepID=UPI0019031500|nr:hypothetical protein [Marinobacter sp. 1-4A]MBK1849938.1 hypothetical protein [Marinobacter sp. 1-4A]